MRDFLTTRRGLLDAVVFSGGEPTSQKALLDAVLEVAALGFDVGLHTAGPHPERLRRLLGHLDWVGMDIKAPFDRYDAITRVPTSGDKARKCVQSFLDHGIAYEFRTTVDLLVLSADDVIRIATTLADLGVRTFALQRARATHPSGGPDLQSAGQWLDDATVGRVESHFDNFVVRD